MTEKSCVDCYYAHANCEDKSLACESEEQICDDYMGIRKIERNMIDKVLAIIEDYDLYKADEDGDIVACRSEILGEIEHLKGGEQE